MNKFGLFIYNYNRSCYLYDKKCQKDNEYYGCNIGDYIQSLAARQFLPKVDYLIDRDNLSDIKAPVKLICNGWFCLNDYDHLFSPLADPLIVSFNISNTNNSDFEKEKCLCYLRNYSKKKAIGCRDINTLRFLRKNNIEAYFSSCLTTTLKRNDFTKKSIYQKSGKVILCDVTDKQLTSILKKPFPINRFIKNFKSRMLISHLLKNYSNMEYSFTTHNFKNTITHDERFKLAKDLLTQYAEADLVITSRIHCALPCLAFNTPVILISEYDSNRFEGLDNLLNHIWIDSKKNILEYDIKCNQGKVINKKDYSFYADKLINTCKEFIFT